VGNGYALNVSHPARFGSLQSAVASVDTSGLVVLRKPGRASIEVQTLDGKHTIIVPVTVIGEALPEPTLTIEQRIHALEEQAHRHE
jgi:hypothetical protein